MPDQAQIDEFYRKHYGFDPSKLTPEQMAHADGQLAEISPAVNAPRVLGTPTGGWVENPAYVKVRKSGGLDAKSAHQLAVYQAWKNGELPEETRPLSDDEKRQHKITPEMMKSYEGDREKRTAEWVASKAQRFANLVAVDDNAERSDKEVRPVEMEPETVTAAAPKAKSKEGGPASQPSSAPAEAPADDQAKPKTVAWEKKGTTVRRSS